MPTGSGKSLTYQLPALFLPKPVVVVSPLIALMQDQQDHARDAEIDAHKLDSTLTSAQQREADATIAAGSAGLLYVTPERLENRDFLDQLNEHGVSLFVVDEAHTIAQWGHDFRPAYLGLGHARKKLGNPPVLALTATATQDVVQEILQQLHAHEACVINAGSERTNLFLTVHATVNEDAKIDRILRLVADEPGIGIIYTASVRAAEELYVRLQEHGIAVGRYHGRMSKHEREEAQAAFMANSYKVMIATKAFGLGIDKPDIRFVCHYEFPDSLESYFQEAGRAGRDGEPAQAVLLYRLEDKRIQTFFSRGRYPKAEEMDKLMNVLSADEPQALEAIAQAAEVGKRHAQVILYLLRDAKLVKRKRAGFLRKEGVAIADGQIEAMLRGYMEREEHDKSRLDEMMHYAQTATCRRQILREYFGEEVGEPCGQCDNCVNHVAENHEQADTQAGSSRDAVTYIETIHGTIATTAPETLVREHEGPKFAVGTIVRHKTFGKGEVLEEEGETLTVRFSGGTKRLKDRFVSALDS